MIGEKILSLYDVLDFYSGHCENLELTLLLMSDTKKVGELITFMDGLNVDMRLFPSLDGEITPAASSSSESPRPRTVLNRGAIGRIRVPVVKPIDATPSPYPVQQSPPNPVNSTPRLGNFNFF